MEKIKRLTLAEARKINIGQKLSRKHGTVAVWEFTVYAILLGVEGTAPYFRGKYERKWVSWQDCYINDGWINDIP
jgi:hypothetical protein